MTDAEVFKPTIYETKALLAFAEAHGRTWKKTLTEVYWPNARLWRGPDGRDDVIGSVLHGIRNRYGPSWLLDPRVTLFALSVHLAELNDREKARELADWAQELADSLKQSFDPDPADRP